MKLSAPTCNLLNGQKAHHFSVSVLKCPSCLCVSEATAKEPYGCNNKTEVKVTNEKGEDILEQQQQQHGRTQSQATSSSFPKDTSPLSSRRFTSSEVVGPSYLHSNDKEGPRGDQAAVPGPVATSSPFQLKSSPTVADNQTTCKGVASVDPSMNFGDTKHLVLGDESLDFMKLSIRENSSSSGGGVWSNSRALGLNALQEEMSSSEEGEGGLGEEEEENRKKENEFRPLLIFIPLRLGQDRFNEQYKDALKV